MVHQPELVVKPGLDVHLEDLEGEADRKELLRQHPQRVIQRRVDHKVDPLVLVRVPRVDQLPLGPQKHVKQIVNEHELLQFRLQGGVLRVDIDVGGLALVHQQGAHPLAGVDHGVGKGPLRQLRAAAPLFAAPEVEVLALSPAARLHLLPRRRSKEVPRVLERLVIAARLFSWSPPCRLGGGFPERQLLPRGRLERPRYLTHMELLLAVRDVFPVRAPHRKARGVGQSPDTLDGGVEFGPPAAVALLAPLVRRGGRGRHPAVLLAEVSHRSQLRRHRRRPGPTLAATRRTRRRGEHLSQVLVPEHAGDHGEVPVQVSRRGLRVGFLQVLLELGVRPEERLVVLGVLLYRPLRLLYRDASHFVAGHHLGEHLCGRRRDPVSRPPRRQPHDPVQSLDKPEELRLRLPARPVVRPPRRLPSP
mmetsp:Transcript_4736/g.14129  ORF Transcript_4736/g.14129 Transcript_4736/m.14129 type:complete len:419 (+) Transcript_4736:2139-3395(+)